MKIHFYLDSKVKKNTSKTIYCFIRGLKSKSTIYLKTDISLDPINWNPKTERVRKSHPNSNVINNYLEKMVSTITDEILKLKLDFTNSSDYEKFKIHLKNIINPELNDIENSNNVKNPSTATDKPIHMNFWQSYDYFVSSKSSQVSLGTIKRYQVIKNLLIEFCINQKLEIDFEIIDSQFFDKLIPYLTNNRGLTNNTAKKYLNVFKVFLNWAIERKLLSNSDYKNANIQGFEPDIIVLTEVQLSTICSLDLNQTPHLDKVRDIFCFECFTGQRISDILNIDFNDIKDGIWKLRTKKTKEIISVPLVSRAMDIIEKYRSQNLPFPKLSDQKINQYLKEIGKIAEFEELHVQTRYKGAKRINDRKPLYQFLTTHVARKTFISLCLSKQINAQTVMSISGHKDPRTMKRYIQISEQAKQESLKKVFE